MLAAAACGSTAQTGLDGGGGSAAAGTGGGGRGGSGGAAGTDAGGGTGGNGNGGTTGAGGGGRGGVSGSGGSTGAGGASAGGTGGSVPCGTTVCTSSELCVRGSCAFILGTKPCNLSLPDGGQCPSGSTYILFCPNITGPGCYQSACTTPDPYCLPIPTSCGATPTCSCLPTDVCHGYGGCTDRGISGGVLNCLSA